MKLNMASLCFLEQSKFMFLRFLSLVACVLFPRVLWRWAQVWELGWCFPRDVQFPSGAVVVFLLVL